MTIKLIHAELAMLGNSLTLEEVAALYRRRETKET
jgi:hypothetical protein